MGEWASERVGEWENGSGRVGEWESGRAGEQESRRAGEWESGRATLEHTRGSRRTPRAISSTQARTVFRMVLPDAHGVRNINLSRRHVFLVSANLGPFK